MNSTADLRWPFAVRPLTAKLGAEISGVSLAGEVPDDASSSSMGESSKETLVQSVQVTRSSPRCTHTNRPAGPLTEGRAAP